MKSFGYIALIALAFFSCEKDEIPVEYLAPQISQGTVFRQIDMQADYRNRVYYDMESDSVIASHLRSEWDIAFACGENEQKVRMNDSRLMTAYRIEGQSIDEVTSFSGSTARYDESDGTTAALDDWQEGAPVYVLYLGTDENEVDRGYHKVQILSVSATAYTIAHAPLAADTHEEVTIEKDDSRGFIHFSFAGGVRLLEPPKEDWDLLFTQYTYFFSPEENPFGNFELHYIVAGTLLNPYQVAAASLTEFDFEAIDSEYLDVVPFTEEEDIIGYAWKEYDIDAQLYTILDNAFAVNTVEGNRYTLQFTSFIDSNGERGAPTFTSRLVD